MFIGEASLMGAYKVQQARKQRKHKGQTPDNSDLRETLLPSQTGVPAHLFALPAFFDVFATGLGAVALMFINAAVWQMLRGSLVVFSAIFSITFLRRSLQSYHWVGIFIVVVGLFLVGYSAILDTSSASTATDSGKTGLGVSLVIFAQVFSGAQYVFEEYLLTGREVSSLQTVGMEGCWGFGFMVVILCVMTLTPGDDHGVYESLPDGLHMLAGSRQLQCLFTTYMLCVAGYNFVGMQLCRKLSAVTRCLVDSMRTCVVWAFQLFMYYCVSPSYGQPWTRNSYMQLLGFACLLLGTFIYNRVVKLPAVNYRKLALPQRVLQATWSPTVNRGGLWGQGPSHGLHSPNPNMSPPGSPVPIFGVYNSPACLDEGDVTLDYAIQDLTMTGLAVQGTNAQHSF
jgi:drug/metabolite transporter (DMT)-like permease